MKVDDFYAIFVLRFLILQYTAAEAPGAPGTYYLHIAATPASGT